MQCNCMYVEVSARNKILSWWSSSEVRYIIFLEATQMQSVSGEKDCELKFLPLTKKTNKLISNISLIGGIYMPL